jgi:uncharacterized repeat protein (TIGR03803 family)
MKKVQEPTARKTRTVATCRIHWQPRIGLLAALVAMSVVMLGGQELKHVPPASPSFTVLHSFTGPPTDGELPLAGLVQDGAGNLYGTTAVGGASKSGVVYKLSPSGTETVLYSFTGGADGAVPEADLIRDAAGNLYGTTVYGGACALDTRGCGVVFKLSPTGAFTVLHTFTGGLDGGNPYAGVTRDAAGNLYGTTVSGGAHRFGGVVFKLSPSGTETVLYSFTGGADGAEPYADVIRDAVGNLYGTTIVAGVSPVCCGTVFKLSPRGTFTVLHSFTGADGSAPVAGLTQDTATGNFYGTTNSGGSACFSPGGCGVVFELIRCDTAASGYELKVLHSFTGGADGALPFAGLVRDSAGNLYGTTRYGGSTACPPYFDFGQCGVVFKLSPTGAETVLHSFTGADGANPSAGLIQDTAGNLYGTTGFGGAACSYDNAITCGVVFRLAPN